MNINILTINTFSSQLAGPRGSSKKGPVFTAIQKLRAELNGELASGTKIIEPASGTLDATNKGKCVRAQIRTFPYNTNVSEFRREGECEMLQGSTITPSNRGVTLLFGKEARHSGQKRGTIARQAKMAAIEKGILLVKRLTRQVRT